MAGELAESDGTSTGKASLSTGQQAIHPENFASSDGIRFCLFEGDARNFRARLRLEQERIPMSAVESALTEWLARTL